jgi:methionyl aminopeptidase
VSIKTKSWAELQKMHQACTLVVETLDVLEKAAVPGVTTKELDKIAHDRIVGAGAKPAFLGYKVRGRAYPASLCVSVNDEIVHGIPSKRKLVEGDIVGLDLGAIVDGYYGDAARTVAVGKITAEAEKLMKVTQESLLAAIDQVRVGKRIGDIGHAVQQHAERYGYSLAQGFTGHGIGTRLHEEPEVPNAGKPGHGPRLVRGMCLAIEPMVNIGGGETEMLEDEWTAVTADGSLSAHYELTVAVTEYGPWILSEPYPYGQEQRAHG